MTAIRKQRETPEIPDFEGQEVGVSKVKLTSTTGLEYDDVVRMDDIVRVVVEARVCQVHHNVNERTGLLERVQTLRALSVDVAPWSESDTGIVSG